MEALLTVCLCLKCLVSNYLLCVECSVDEASHLSPIRTGPIAVLVRYVYWLSVQSMGYSRLSNPQGNPRVNYDCLFSPW